MIALLERGRGIFKTKGVGPKLAQRIVLELKDKIAKESITTSDIKSSGNIFVPEGDNCAEAVSALMVLGFSQEEVAAAVSKNRYISGYGRNCETGS